MSRVRALNLLALGAANPTSGRDQSPDPMPSPHCPVPLCVTVLSAAVLFAGTATSQAAAFGTFGSALTVRANYSQPGFDVARTCNARNAGASWQLSTGQFDGWAVTDPSLGVPSGDSYAAWTFRAGSSSVRGMQLLCNAAIGGHWVRDFEVHYTTDPTPSLAGNWLPVTGISPSVPGATVAGSRVTYPTFPLPNLADLRITFAAINATGIRLHVFSPGGTGSGGNFVITEVTFDATVPGFVAVGGATTCAGPLGLSVNGRPRLGDAAFAWQGTNAPANGLGAMFLGTNTLSAALPLVGIAIWLDPTGAISVTTVANDWGAWTVGLPLPAQPSLAGSVLAAQTVWLEACAPAGLTSTAAGRITLQ